MATPICSHNFKERVLLSAEAKHYTSKTDYTLLQLHVTKTRLIISSPEFIFREIALQCIDSITMSLYSKEFVVHLHQDTDERFASSKFKRPLIELLVYLMTTQQTPGAKQMRQKAKLYAVEDLTLDFFVTSDEDVEDGNMLRPEQAYMAELTYPELLNFFTEQE
jgi:hypothetical protein